MEPFSTTSVSSRLRAYQSATEISDLLPLLLLSHTCAARANFSPAFCPVRTAGTHLLRVYRTSPGGSGRGGLTCRSGFSQALKRQRRGRTRPVWQSIRGPFCRGSHVGMGARTYEPAMEDMSPKQVWDAPETRGPKPRTYLPDHASAVTSGAAPASAWVPCFVTDGKRNR
jgi:hypothetical protein